MRRAMGVDVKPRRERMAPWKAIICWFAGHDWGMFFDPSLPSMPDRNGKVFTHGGYKDICVRCGHRK